MNLHLPKSTFALLIALLCCSALFAAPAGAAAARPGTVSGTIQGLPKKAKSADRHLTVRVVNIETGQIAAVLKPKGSKFSVKLPAGGYALAIRSVDLPGVATASRSTLVQVKPGKKARVKVKTKKVGKKKRASKKIKKSDAPAAWYDNTIDPTRKIVGVDPKVTISGLDEYPSGLDIDSMVITDVSKGCPGGSPDFDLVEIRNIDEIIKEIALGDSPYFDQTKKVKKGHLRKARQMIKGGGSVTNGRLSLNLTMVDVATGEVLASSAVEGPVDQFFDLVATLDERLMSDFCGNTVDIKLTGNGTYSRNEGGAAEQDEDHVNASFDWSITYKNVKLGATPGPIYFGTSSLVSGTWSVNGRFGAVGPGNYSCSGPVTGFNGDFALAQVAKTTNGYRISAYPYTSAQTDGKTTTCSGLPGAPYASFVMTGFSDAAKYVFDIDPLALGSGPITTTVLPAATVASDCSDYYANVHLPCDQSFNWSGTATITKSDG